jgi:hypothetical protein
MLIWYLGGYGVMIGIPLPPLQLTKQKAKTKIESKIVTSLFILNLLEGVIIF